MQSSVTQYRSGGLSFLKLYRIPSELKATFKGARYLSIVGKCKTTGVPSGAQYPYSFHEQLLRSHLWRSPFSTSASTIRENEGLPEQNEKLYNHEHYISERLRSSSVKPTKHSVYQEKNLKHQLLPTGLDPQSYGDWQSLLSLVQQFFFSKRDNSREFFYPQVRQLVLRLGSRVLPQEGQRWIDFCPKYWMVLFESLNLLSDCCPYKEIRNRNNMVVSRLSEAKMTTGQDALSSSNGTESETFFQQEECWIQWIVEVLRHCKNVPLAVRETVPITHVVTLLNVMDQWNLWREGDEMLIAYAMNGCQLERIAVIAEVIGSLISHKRPLLPLLRTVTAQTRLLQSGRRIPGGQYLIRRMSGLARSHLEDLMRSRPSSFVNLEEHLCAWEDMQNTFFLTSVTGVTNSFLKSSMSVREADFYSLRIGNFLRAINKWPYPIRPLSLQSAISSQLKNLPLIDLDALRHSNAHSIFSYLDQVSHLFGCLCLSVKKGLATNSKTVSDKELLINVLDNSSVEGCSKEARSYSMENPIYRQMLDDLAQAADLWKSVLEPVATGQFDELLEKIRSQPQEKNSPHSSTTSTKQQAVDGDCREEGVDVAREKVDTTIPTNELFRTSAACVALVALDLMTRFPSTPSISAHTELLIGQRLQNDAPTLNFKTKSKLRLFLHDAGVPWRSDLMAILNARPRMSSLPVTRSTSLNAS